MLTRMEPWVWLYQIARYRLNDWNEFPYYEYSLRLKNFNLLNWPKGSFVNIAVPDKQSSDDELTLVFR